MCAVRPVGSLTTLPRAPAPDDQSRLGVLAFGDSITNGGGELQWGIALQSWALWTARGLGLPYTGYALDGARVADVLGRQLPAFERRAVPENARYHVGCLYIGVNDVRSVDWAPGPFEHDFESALSYIRGHCERMLVLTAPLGLGFPPTGARVSELNAIVREAAARHDALVVDLESFGARNQVMVDRVHPTALGQIAIAERALAVLQADGLAPRLRPSSLVEIRSTRWQRLRGDSTYAYRQAKLRAGVLLGGRR
jgi:lysophospholipase L1-like esterase